MKDNISKRDWETISAYLDGQLSERKQARLESRLEHDQQLRAALDELRDTRYVLRSSPRLRPPRNYMLTPEMAGQPHRLPNLAPIFGWASAVASFLFVLFLVGDLFSAGGAIPMALNNIPAQEEFVAPRGQVADDIAAQPAANVGGMNEPSSPSAESSAPAEIREGEALPEAAAVPEIESAPKEKNTPITKAIDMIGAAELVAEEAEIEPEAEFAGEEMDAGVAFSAEPEDEADVADVAAITDTEEVESAPEPHLLAPPVVETEPDEEEIIVEAAPLPIQVVVPSPVASASPTLPLPEPMLTAEIEPIRTETPLKSAPVVVPQNGLIIGAEVILGLVALGAGLAWVYLRRRGG